MAGDDLPVACAQALRRSDEVAAAQRKRLPAHHAAVGNPALGHQRQDQVEQTLTQKRHDRDAEQERWKSPNDFDEFLNREIDFAAEIAGDCAEPDADKA